MKYYICCICKKKKTSLSTGKHKTKIIKKNKLKNKSVLVCCNRRMREITKTIYKEP